LCALTFRVLQLAFAKTVMKFLRFSVLSVLLISATTTFADHNAILPRPQQVHYGNGALHVRGLHFKSAPSTEDRFAAEQLADRLSEIAQTRIGKQRRSFGGRAIVLNQTGES